MFGPDDLATWLRRRPPPAALRWVERAVGRGAEVVAARRMRGAWSAAVHAVTVRDPAGARRQLVLRRYVRADWLAREPDLAEREARVLTLLARSDVPAPRLVAVDATGRETDVPAVLMTRVPGRVDLAPRDLDRWLERLAAPLAAIHAVDASGVAVQPYRPYYDLPAQATPPWTRHRAAWERMSERMRAPAPAAPAVFIHRDYHPGNVLWSRGRVSAVLDWVNASIGPAGVDVAHCRSNLVALFGMDAAERFRAAYEALPGARPHDPYRDAASLLDADLAAEPPPDEPDAWHDQGRADVTLALRRERLDAYAELIASRL